MASAPDALHELPKVAAEIETAYHSSVEYQRIVDDITRCDRVVFKKQGEHKLLVQSCFPTADSSKRHEINGLAHDVPCLYDLLQVASALVGAKHEGKPLNFILLCAPETALLRYYLAADRERNAPRGLLETTDSRGTTPWFLKKKVVLKKTDFPPTDEDGNIGHEAVGYATRANALLLQEPGHALFFRPKSAGFWPHAVAEFVPFDSRYIDSMLEAFTRKDRVEQPTHLAIQVRTKDVVLFALGRKMAFMGDTGWRFHGGLGGTAGIEPLTKFLCERTILAKLNNTEQHRLKIVCRSVVSIARKGHGALFFLKCETLNHQITTTDTAPVWGVEGSIDRADPETLAAVAGLDGETVVDLTAGTYRARQFVHPRSDAFVNVLDLQTSDVPTWNMEFLKRWNKEQMLRKETDPEMDSLAETYNFGTRHQKAMRVTWGYSTIVAITVSSNGAIRVWSGGIPIAKFGI